MEIILYAEHRRHISKAVILHSVIKRNLIKFTALLLIYSTKFLWRSALYSKLHYYGCIES